LLFYILGGYVATDKDGKLKETENSKQKTLNKKQDAAAEKSEVKKKVTAKTAAKKNEVKELSTKVVEPETGKSDKKFDVSDFVKAPSISSQEPLVSSQGNTISAGTVTAALPPAQPAPMIGAPVNRPVFATPQPVMRPMASRPAGMVTVINGRRVWRSGGVVNTSVNTPTNGNSGYAAPNQVEQRGFGGGFAQSNATFNPLSGSFAGEVDGRIIPDAGMPTEMVTGFLDVMRDGNGILRSKYSSGDRDAYISGTQLRRFKIRPGDEVTGPARKPKENEQYWGLLKVDLVNGKSPEEMAKRVKFESLTPVYPDEKIVLETTKETLSTRLIDMVAPVGRGQRGLIVSPPKAGKTTILKDIATGIAENYPDIHLMAVLVGERPEEVTDIMRHIAKETKNKGEVAASNFDEQATEQVRVAELALERAKRMVETGKHVVILLDSITRLARAYNLAMPTSGRTLSGGFDPAALYPPKRFFGAARNFEDFETVDGKKRASLTILGTALVDTGSRMDDLVYEEFKGTGNMELHLDRELAERRIYPSIDVQRSGTRKEELLFDGTDYQSVILLRRMIDMLDPRERTAVIIGRMKNTKTNREFMASLKEG
jgi:transcription termination factor Rho